jgi:hypothetical protein
MRKFSVLLAAGLFMATNASAQVSGSAQANAQSNTNSTTSVGSSGASTATRAQTSGSASAQANAGHDSISSGTTFHSTLSRPLDAKKAKPGDKVEARTTDDVKQDGRVVLPKGTRLEGHVTQAQARSKDDSQSTLGIAFDRAILRDGDEMPLHVGIQALAESAAVAESSVGDDAEMMPEPNVGGAVGGAGHAGGGVVGGVAHTAGGAVGGASSMAGNATGAVGGVAGNAGGVVGGVAGNAGGAVGSTVGAATRTTAAVGGLDAAGRLTSDSQGVFGIQGLQLASAVSSDSQGSLLVSSTRNVHLSSGTQILLRATGEVQ